MLPLVAGLFLFLGTHLFTAQRVSRAAMIERFGENGYKGFYSLLSLAGFILLIYGYGVARSEGQPLLWDPPVWTHHLVALLMLPVFPLLLAAYLPGRIKRATKHPMMLAVKIWATAHLVANGDLASLVLFGAFLAWGVIGRISVKRREATEGAPAPVAGSATNDIIVLVVGLALYVGFVFFAHEWLIGVPVFA